MNAIAVIPARFASTRFCGKPLARDTGRYLIQHVYERVVQANSISRAIIATDDQRIAEAGRSFGAEVAMTRADHPSGTDRVAEVAAGLKCDLVINVQGDEPEIEPANIDHLVAALVHDASCSMATLACPFSRLPEADPADPAAVKVVLARNQRALYFSRSLIPHRRADADVPIQTDDVLLHLGIYAYRRDFLLQLVLLPPTPLEQTERLEQLRVLENGYQIAVAVVEQASLGIDTPADYAAFVKRFNAISLEDKQA